MASNDDNSMMNTERISERRSSAQSSVEGRGSSVSSQRTNHRTEFLNKLKTLRNRNMDQFRRLSTDKIRKVLLADTGPEDSTTTRELIIALENELLYLEAPEYDYLTETDQIADNLMEQCIICKTLVVSDIICSKCVQSEVYNFFNHPK